MNSKNEEEPSSWERLSEGARDVVVGLWGLLKRPVEKASQGAVRVMTILLGVLSLVFSVTGVRIDLQEIVLPQIPNSALISVVIAMVLVQTWYHRRRFMRVEEQIQAMDTKLLEADGGEDTVGNLLLAVAGFFLGLGLGQIYFPEYAFPLAFLCAFLSVQFASKEQ